MKIRILHDGIVARGPRRVLCGENLDLPEDEAQNLIQLGIAAVISSEIEDGDESPIPSSGTVTVPSETKVIVPQETKDDAKG